MFLQATTSRRKKKTYISWLVRESFRTPQGPRSRTICNVSGLPEAVRNLIADVLQGKTMVDLNELELSSALNHGGLAVLRDAWQRFGLDRFLADIPSARDRGLLQAMIFARLLFPCAKLALAEHAEGTLLADACGLNPKKEHFNEDDLYAAMDQLNGRWVALEKQLYQEAFPQSVRLVLYDLTSVYFEGKGPRGLAKYGYSRDHRTDRHQILLVLATDTQGTPIHIEVLRGNRGDTTTLQGLLANLQRRFGIKEAIFVFDGGMSSHINLEQMEAQQLQYATRLSAATLGALLKELPCDQQPELWDRTRLMEVTHQGKRYVIAGGEWRQQRDQERRGSRIQKFDDWYVLHTNLSVEQCDGKQVLGHYKNLLEVEEAFCQLKSYLEVRPVFHWRPDRVRNHVRICFLAYWLSTRLGQQWRALGEKGEAPRLLRWMQTIRVGTLRVKKRLLGRKMTHVPSDLNSLLKKLDLLKLFAQPPAWVSV